jgi:hypothetical protein
LQIGVYSNQQLIESKDEAMRKVKYSTLQYPQKYNPALDKIARAKQVSRAAVIRWAIEAYIASSASNGLLKSTVVQAQPDARLDAELAAA